MVRSVSLILLGALVVPSSLLSAQSSPVYLAGGIKIGEVSSTSAIVWARTTAEPGRNRSGLVVQGRPAVVLEDGVSPDSLEGSVAGAAGRLRVRYLAIDGDGPAVTLPIVSTSADSDFSFQFALDGLRPGTRYRVTVESLPMADDAATAGRSATFTTAPAANDRAPVRFTAMTCQYYGERDSPDGFAIYPSMAGLEPSFYLSIGDNVYYDNEAPRTNSIAVARYHWQRMFSLPLLTRFLEQVPGYWLKDDHDTHRNDSWPGVEPGILDPFTFEQGQRLFVEQIPMGERTWRTTRWGRGLELFLLEGRDFRSPNDMPDGPEKTILGQQQLEWLRRELARSDADWKIVVSATPIVGPDRANKADNHANAIFAYEGTRLRQLLKDAGDNVVVVVGDRHWQYHSVDPATGLHEFSVGPASDEHAGGTPGEDAEYHRFHRLAGGFLSVDVEWRGDRSSLLLRHRDVQAAIVYEHRFSGDG